MPLLPLAPGPCRILNQYSFDHCLLSTYYMPGVVLGVEQSSPIPADGKAYNKEKSKVNRMPGGVKYNEEKGGREENRKERWCLSFKQVRVGFPQKIPSHCSLAIIPINQECYFQIGDKETEVSGLNLKFMHVNLTSWGTEILMQGCPSPTWPLPNCPKW